MTKKCLCCKKRFIVQGWKTGWERELCFTCNLIQEIMGSTAVALNSVLRDKNKPGKISVLWKID